MAGAWTMTDEGEFVLNEPYKTKVEEAKNLATKAWMETMLSFVADETGYDEGDLFAEFCRLTDTGRSPMEVVESFVIEALEGTLFETDI